MGKYIDVNGKVFGEWTVLGRDNQRRKGSGRPTYMLCECSCGRVVSVNKKNITRGLSTKCRECGAKKHGGTSTRLYNIWLGIKGRLKRDPLYSDLPLWHEWLSFEVFKKWSLENGYSDNLSIDRIDGNHGYSPHNCRWTTKYVQSANKRKNDGNLIGVFKHHICGYKASIGVDYKQIHIKSSKSQAVCALARDMYILARGLPHTLNLTWYKPTNKVGWIHG